MKLHQLAHSRTGDKGDTSNISVIAYDASDYDYLCQQLSPERVQTHLQGLMPEVPPEEWQITRYELPQLQALNFVISGVLRGGVTRSTALDAHGKSLSSLMLDLELEEK